MEKNLKRAAIVAEYLSGGISYRELQVKYGYSLGALHKWVKEYLSAMGDTTLREEVNELMDAGLGAAMPADIKELQAELRKSRLHNKLLTAVIEIAEEELNAPIRKKYGTRQS